MMNFKSLKNVFFIITSLLFGVYAEDSNVLSQNYNPSFIKLLHVLYGDGFLAEGSVDSTKLLINNLDLNFSKVLDFGCGTGGGAHFISNHYTSIEVIGVDGVNACIQTARQFFPASSFPNLSFIHCQSEYLPFESGSFDYVFVKEVFIHAYDKANILKELYRVLKKGGKLVIIDWFASSEVYANCGEDPIIQLSSFEQFNLDALYTGFTKSSFRDVTTEYKNFVQETINKITNYTNTAQNGHCEMIEIAKDYGDALYHLLQKLKEHKTAALRLEYQKI